VNDSLFEEIDHTADWALQVSGADFSALLQNAAMGMLKLIRAEAVPGPGVKKVIHLEASDGESLLPLLRLEKEIKAVTYHNLKIHQGPAGFNTTIVFDV
jgi:SHS2 domain-containing protein